MKKILLTTFLISIRFFVFGQILYDDGPIIIDDESSRYVVQGNKWNSPSISYYFQNGTNDIARNDEKQAIREAFSLWSCVTPLYFGETSSSVFADIIILWGTNDHGDNFPFDDTGGVLAHAFYPPPNGDSLAGDMHFDDDEVWTLNIRKSSGQPIDLVTVAAHEIGHALGLGHSSDPNALMYAYYFGSHRFLGEDDIAGIQSIYPPLTNELTETVNSGQYVSHTSSNYINSSSIIENRGTAYYEAVSVTLIPDFHAKKGSIFNAMATDCFGGIGNSGASRIVNQQSITTNQSHSNIELPSVNTTHDRIKVVIYPNPNDKFFNIDLIERDQDTSYKLKIINSEGLKYTALTLLKNQKLPLMLQNLMQESIM